MTYCIERLAGLDVCTTSKAFLIHGPFAQRLFWLFQCIVHTPVKRAICGRSILTLRGISESLLLSEYLPMYTLSIVVLLNSITAKARPQLLPQLERTSKTLYVRSMYVCRESTGGRGKCSHVVVKANLKLLF